MRTPRTGDCVTLASFPDDVYTIFVCHGTQCGVMADGWPVGATASIELHQLSTVNGVVVNFPATLEESARRTKNRR
jgi:hypothetical protein